MCIFIRLHYLFRGQMSKAHIWRGGGVSFVEIFIKKRKLGKMWKILVHDILDLKYLISLFIFMFNCV